MTTIDQTHVIHDIRALSRVLTRQSSQQSGAQPISNAMMKVICCIMENGPLSVPNIARRLGVGRQHIQRTVNAMMERDLASRKVNPDHQRSWLIELSALGKVMADKNIASLEPSRHGISADDLKTCHDVLKQLEQSYDLQKPETKVVAFSKQTSIQESVATPATDTQFESIEEPQSDVKSISWNSGVGLKI